MNADGLRTDLDRDVRRHGTSNSGRTAMPQRSQSRAAVGARTILRTPSAAANDNLPAIMDTSTGGCGFDNPVIMTGPSQPPVEFAIHHRRHCRRRSGSREPDCSSRSADVGSLRSDDCCGEEPAHGA